MNLRMPASALLAKTGAVVKVLRTQGCVAVQWDLGAVSVRKSRRDINRQEC